MNEHEYEPQPGLPEALPPGETILWQGSPRFGALALHAFHLRKVAIYFAALMAWRGGSDLAEGQPVAVALGSVIGVAPLALLGLGLLALLAWLTARSTIYTITSQRVVFRFGIALELALNVPYTVVESAALRAFRDGSGDIPLSLARDQRIGWFVNWPHVRPWSRAGVQPMLRAVPDAPHVARILGAALEAATGARAATPGAAATSASSPCTRPARPQATAAA